MSHRKASAFLDRGESRPKELLISHPECCAIKVVSGKGPYYALENVLEYAPRKIKDDSRNKGVPPVNERMATGRIREILQIRGNHARHL